MILFYSIIRAVVALQFLSASTLLVDGLGLLFHEHAKLRGAGKVEVMVSLGLFLLSYWEWKVATVRKRQLISKRQDNV